MYIYMYILNELGLKTSRIGLGYPNFGWGLRLKKMGWWILRAYLPACLPYLYLSYLYLSYP